MVRAQRIARGGTAALAALTLVVSVAGPSLERAAADDAIRQQPYAQQFDLKGLHEKGYNGEGVTIAYIEAAPDTSSPELRGASIEVRKPCDMNTTPSLTAHSNMVASILVNQEWGWAPKAKLVNYTALLKGAKPSDDCRKAGDLIMHQIHRALNDGVDIINLSVGIGDALAPEHWLRSESDARVLERAAALGVPVVASAGNTGKRVVSGQSFGQYNTVVGVGSTSLKGVRSSFSTVGPHLVVSAPGEQLTKRDPDSQGRLTVINRAAKGTSVSAPMVTGLLALGMQRWPDATANQLLQSLVKTANNGGRGWTEQHGWGLIDVTKFLNTDPSSFEDVNPLWNKKDIDATSKEEHQQITQKSMAEYQDGLVDPVVVEYDESYVYRGVDDSIARQNPDRSELGTSPRYRK